jgi:hypothetical protein
MARLTTLRCTVLTALAAGAVAACSATLPGEDEFTEAERSLLDRANELSPAPGSGPGDKAVDITESSGFGAEINGVCSTRGCGGIVANHANSYIKVANCYGAGDGPIPANQFTCVQFPNDWTRHPGDFWLRPNRATTDFPAYYDTDAFIAFGGCKTTVTKWFKSTLITPPVLLGRWEYDRRNLGSEWIKLNDLTFVDILAIECQGAPPAPPAPTPPAPPPQRFGEIKVLSSNMCLVARVGAGERPVVQVPCAGFSDQIWSIEYLWGGRGPEGLAQLKNRDRGLCLATRGTGESPAVVTTCNTGWFDQLWFIVRDPNTGYYQFKNQNSKLCLVVRGGSAETQAVQSNCGTQWADQLWIWEGWF